MLRRKLFPLVLATLGFFNNCKANPTAQLATDSADKTAYLLNARGLTLDKALTATLSAVQGILNRHTPSLFIINYPERDWEHAYIRNGENLADKNWIGYFRERLHFNFIEIDDLWELVRQQKAHFPNIILFPKNSDKNAKLYVTLTYAALNNLLPLSHELYQKNLKLQQLYPAPLHIDQFCQGTTFQEIYRWAIINLLPHTNRKFAFSDNWDSLAGSDYIVKEKGFFYHLNYARPAEVEIIKEILAHLDPLAHIFGWGDPSEHYYAPFLSTLGQIPYAIHTPNLSFFTDERNPQTSWKQPANRQLNTKAPKQKILVALMVAEGDTPKIAKTLYGGNWASSCRGNVVLNWGINPKFSELFPTMFSYYYRSASPNDYFFVPTSGAGYAYLGYFSSALRKLYMAQSAAYMATTDTGIVDLWIWDPYFYDHFNKYNRVTLAALVGEYQASNSSLQGIVVRSRFSSTPLQRIAAIPLINCELYYWKSTSYQWQFMQENSALALANALKRLAREKSLQQVVVYLDLAERDIPCLAAELNEYLGDKFALVTLKQMFSSI